LRPPPPPRRPPPPPPPIPPPPPVPKIDYTNQTNGATISMNGNLTVYTYKSSGKFVAPVSGKYGVLIVGGGGGGGWYGGGGGAGGLVYFDIKKFNVFGGRYI
jgi:hypothetical protein